MSLEHRAKGISYSISACVSIFYFRGGGGGGLSYTTRKTRKIFQHKWFSIELNKHTAKTIRKKRRPERHPKINIEINQYTVGGAGARVGGWPAAVPLAYTVSSVSSSHNSRQPQLTSCWMLSRVNNFNKQLQHLTAAGCLTSCSWRIQIYHLSSLNSL